MTGRAGSASVFMVVLIGILWGMNWPAVKIMLVEIPPLTIRATAFPLAALLLLLIARLMGEKIWPARRDFGPIVLTGLLLVFGFNVLTSFGQLMTETSKAAIIAYTMPAMTAILAVIFLRERLDFRLLLALLIGMAALVVLASEDFTALLSNPVGPVIMLLAALSWALGNVALKARKWSLSPLALTIWFFAVASLAVWPLVLMFEPLSGQSWPSTTVLLTMTYHVLGPMVVCYLLWTIALDRLPATVAAIAILTAPVTGVSSSMIVLGDQLTWQKVFSLLMVVTSIAVTLIPKADRDRG